MGERKPEGSPAAALRGNRSGLATSANLRLDRALHASGGWLHICQWWIVYVAGA